MKSFLVLALFLSFTANSFAATSSEECQLRVSDSLVQEEVAYHNQLFTLIAAGKKELALELTEAMIALEVQRAQELCK